jgi:hypothetical protein
MVDRPQTHYCIESSRCQQRTIRRDRIDWINTPFMPLKINYFLKISFTDPSSLRSSVATMFLLGPLQTLDWTTSYVRCLTHERVFVFWWLVINHLVGWLSFCWSNQGTNFLTFFGSLDFNLSLSSSWNRRCTIWRSRWLGFVTAPWRWTKTSTNTPLVKFFPGGRRGKKSGEWYYLSTLRCLSSVARLRNENPEVPKG